VNIQVFVLEMNKENGTEFPPEEYSLEDEEEPSLETKIIRTRRNLEWRKHDLDASYWHMVISEHLAENLKDLWPEVHRRIKKSREEVLDDHVELTTFKARFRALEDSDANSPLDKELFIDDAFVRLEGVMKSEFTGHDFNTICRIERNKTTVERWLNEFNNDPVAYLNAHPTHCNRWGIDDYDRQ